jgi:hypothetical protein
MASKFLVPLQLPELSSGTFADPGVGFVKVYVSNGWLTKTSEDGSVRDLVLDRTLSTYSVAATAAALTTADTLIIALGKLQKSLNSINLTGDVVGSASYISGALTISTTIQPNSVTLGTDTVGDYVAGVEAVPNSGIEVRDSSGEGSVPQVLLKNYETFSDNTIPIWDGGQGQFQDSPIQFNGTDIIVNANFVVNGTTTTVNTETVLIADNIITLNSNATNTPTENAGIEVERGNLANVSLRWNESIDKWELTSNGTTFYTITTSEDSPNVIAGDGIDVTVVGNQVTVSHEDTSSAASTGNSRTQVIQNISVDTFGHVTSIGSVGLKYSAPVGDGVNTRFVITHAKAEIEVLVQVYESIAPGSQVDCDVLVLTPDSIELAFALPPQPDEYYVVII